MPISWTLGALSEHFTELLLGVIVTGNWDKDGVNVCLEWVWQHCDLTMGRVTVVYRFYASQSCVFHFIVAYDLKLELSPANAEIWSKSSIFGLYDLEIWWMTSISNRGPLPCSSMLCVILQPFIALSCGYRPEAHIGFKSSIFRPGWLWNLTDDLEKQ